MRRCAGLSKGCVAHVCVFQRVRVCVRETVRACVCASVVHLKCQIKSSYLLNDYTLFYTQNININTL